MNGEGVTSADDGSFSTPFHFNVGENYIQITAVKFVSAVMAATLVVAGVGEGDGAL